MERYFENIESLQLFALNLPVLGYQVKCKKCQKTGQFVAHDNLYKKQSNGGRILTGKRIFCSNRSGRTGCGSTLRLYLAETLPKLQYACSHLLQFINALSRGKSIQSAYKAATHANDTRNAYRWLNKLYRRLMDYRVLQCSRLRHPTTNVDTHFRTRRLHLLLPTLKSLLSMQAESSIDCFQLSHQKRFI